MKFAAAWAWILGNLATVGVILIAAFLLVTHVQSCRDNNQSKNGAVMGERIRVDTVRDRSDSIATVVALRELDAANETIGRLVGRIQSTPRTPIPVGTPHDSITHLSTSLRACRDDQDTLVKSVVQFQSSCKAFRDTANKTISDLRLSRAHLDSLLKIGKPPKRWGIGVFLGYGIHQDQSWAIKHGLVAGVGITRSIIQW